MPASTLRDSVTRRLTAFAWDQWAQLGVFAPTSRRDQTAADPEAPLLFTFEAGRSDPRLFDETLDWLLTNERLVSVHRLRNLCRDADDRDLVEAALLWVARQQSRSRPAAPARAQRPNESRPLLRRSRALGPVPPISDERLADLPRLAAPPRRPPATLPLAPRPNA
jgi:hypothetical protein